MTAHQGQAWIFGDNINTDLIFPNRYFKPTYEPGELGKVAMTGAMPDFPSRVRKGDVVIGGRNFGCGSSREEAPGALLEAGVGFVLASSYGRIFMRNCINLGVPAILCEGISDHFTTGDSVVVDLDNATIKNATSGYSTRFAPMARELLALLEEGGIMEYTRHELERRSAADAAVPPVTDLRS